MDDPRLEPISGSASHSANPDTEIAQTVKFNRPDLEGADRGRERGYSIEEEEGSVSSDSSEEEVDEHRLLSARFHTKAGVGGGGVKSTGESGGRNPAAGATSVNLSDSWNDEDLDPFSYRPPLTKWDYFKVSLIFEPQTMSGSFIRHITQRCFCDRL